MTWDLIVREKATADLQSACEWYDTKQELLGTECEALVQDALDRLELNPFICQIFYKKFRQILSARFPYRIIYVVSGCTIVVIRVLHASQNFTKLI